MADPFIRNGEAYVRSPDNAQMLAVRPDLVPKLLADGYVPASEADVKAREDAAKARTVGGMATTAGEAAASGFFGTVLMPAKALTSAASAASGLLPGGGFEDPLRDVTGRSTVSGVAGIASHLGGGEFAVGERLAQEDMRARARENPASAFVGDVAGVTAATLGLSGIAGALGAGAALPTSALGRAAVVAGAEGFAQGGAAYTEDAFIQDKELTAEGLWLGAGLGMFLGAGLGAGMSYGGSKLKALFSGEGKGVAGVSDEALSSTVEKLSGSKPTPGMLAKLRDGLEAMQGAALGVSDAEQVALKKYGALRRGQEAISGRELLHNRQEIVESSSRKMADALNNVEDDVGQVLEDAIHGEARLRRIEQLVKSGDDAIQRAEGAKAASRILETLDRIAPANKELAAAANAQFGFARDREAMARHIRKVLRDSAPRTAGAGSLGSLGGAPAVVPARAGSAEVAWALDESKRTIQQQVKMLRKHASNTSSGKMPREEQLQALDLANQLEELETSTRLELEKSYWGDFGEWQKSKNAAWQEFIKTGEEFSRNLTRRVEGIQYDTGRGLYMADPDKVRSFVERLGTTAGDIPEQYVRRHVESIRRLSEAIAKGGDPEKFSVPLRRIQDSMDLVVRELDRSAETVKVANLLHSIGQKESSGALSGAVAGAALGGMVGGLPGAAIGGAAGAAFNPYRMLRQSGAVESMMRTAGERMDGAIGRFFRKHGGTQVVDKSAALETEGRVRLKDLPGFERAAHIISGAKELPKKAGRPARAAAIKFALDGKTDAESFPQRMREVREMTRGTRFIENMAASMGEFANAMPQTYAQVARTGYAMLAELDNAIPPSSSDPDLASIGVKPSRDQLDRFKATWKLAMDPSSILEDMEDGTLDPRTVASFRAMFPRQWQELQRRVLTMYQALDTPPPASARARIDLTFDLGGAVEPTLHPDRLARNNELLRVKLAGTLPKQAPPTPKKLGIAEDFATRTEQVTK